MIYLNQILFKCYENLGICYILYCLDIHQKELKSIQPLFLNPGARLLFVGRSINVLESPEFRELMLFLGDGKLKDKDLPHRMKMTKTILEEFKKERKSLAEDMQNVEGRISFTMDLWSDPNLDSYMVVTAHYMSRARTDGQLEYRCGLIAFKYIEGAHSGVNLAMHFFKLVDSLGVAHKVHSSP